MSLEKIFDIRFLAAPSIILLELLLLFPELREEPGLDLLLSVSLVLVLGFLMSTCVEFHFNKENRKLPKRYRKLSAPEAALKEALIWEALQKRGISEQVHKRWGMAMANYNASVAVCLGVFISIFAAVTHPPNCMVPLTIVALSFFFFYLFNANGDRCVESTHEICEDSLKVLKIPLEQ